MNTNDSSALSLDPRQTALVAIDLQNLIVAQPTQPREPGVVIANTARIANALRPLGGFIVWVRVAFADDGKDRLHPACDRSWSPILPPNPFNLVADLPVAPSDHLVTKRQWGAFFGTDLDLQLRRRGLTTILLTGISTQIGVESTARSAFELGYEQIFVEDAMAAASTAEHEHSIARIFPRIGRVRSTASVLAALSSSTSGT